MKCFICGKENKEEEMTTFTSGEKICKCHIEQFSKNVDFELKKGSKLKELIVDKSIDRIIEHLKEKSLELMGSINQEQLFEKIEMMCQVLQEVVSQEECDKIIKQVKNDIDVYDQIPFEQICYNSSFFQYCYENKLNKKNEQILDKEMQFKILFENVLKFIPKSKEDVDFMLGEEGIDFQLRILPFSLIVRHIWSFFPNVSVEKILASVVNFGGSECLRQKMLKDTIQTQKIIEFLNKKGPLQEGEIKSFNELFNL